MNNPPDDFDDSYDDDGNFDGDAVRQADEAPSHRNASGGPDDSAELSDPASGADAGSAGRDLRGGSRDHELPSDRTAATRSDSAGVGPAKPGGLEDALVDKMRVRHFARSTETCYVGWYRDYVHFHELRHPAEMAEPEVEAFFVRDSHTARWGRFAFDPGGEGTCQLHD